MTQEFVPYEQALALKELGFDEPTSFYWEDNIIRPLPMKDEIGAFHFNRHTHTENEWICAPTFSQAFRWFREKYKIRFFIQSGMSDLGEFFKVIFPNGEQRNMSYTTYEEAELACLKKLIELVKRGDK